MKSLKRGDPERTCRYTKGDCGGPRKPATAALSTVVTVCKRSLTLHILGLASLCAVWLALGVILAAHTLIGASAACTASDTPVTGTIGIHRQSCDDSRGHEQPDSPGHGPSDTHCAASSRDVTSALDVAWFLVNFDSSGPDPSLAFERSAPLTPSAKPALPPRGREILSSSCISRT